MPNISRTLLSAACLALSAASLFAQSQAASQLYPQDPTLPADKYIWLEDVNSPRAMEWVKAENARTAKVLEADPRFAPWAADALKVSE
ncbi:MAG: hypothetical protein WA414_07225, partial [Acidobacteriaceae bacterium]